MRCNIIHINTLLLVESVIGTAEFSRMRLYISPLISGVAVHSVWLTYQMFLVYCRRHADTLMLY